MIAPGPIKPGETLPLCDIQGPGTIRHIWLTTDRSPENLRTLVIRAWWDDQEHPSIECPVIGIRNLHPPQWWGEGEIKVYMDGDKEFPTICGTGSEDYVGLSWGIQQTPFLYNGCSLSQNHFVSMYRWHLADSIAWQKEGRITIQQIAWNQGLKETRDDWSTATFWYEPIPSAALPKMPDQKARTADLWKDPPAKKK